MKEKTKDAIKGITITVIVAAILLGYGAYLIDDVEAEFSTGHELDYCSLPAGGPALPLKVVGMILLAASLLVGALFMTMPKEEEVQ